MRDKDITLAEAKEMKTDLEDAIKMLIGIFSNSTDLCVNAIEIVKYETIDGLVDTSVKIKVFL